MVGAVTLVLSAKGFLLSIYRFEISRDYSVHSWKTDIETNRKKYVRYVYNNDYFTGISNNDGLCN